MSWQLAVVLGIVALAAGYLSWHSWRAWIKSAKGCSGGCGCSAAVKVHTEGDQVPVLISRDSLKLRADR